jgi:hypothetical protein
MARTASKQSLTDTIEHITVGLAPLTEQEIAAQTDANSFKRGRGYARSGHIFRAVRREDTLRARSHGSSGGPYLVEATLAKADQAKRKKRNPVTYSCDCPRGGFCKHVVALLLTWIEQPESFEVRPPVAEVLAKKSREELVALIGMMLRENPDFEDLLDLPVLIAGAPGDEPVDERAIRRQITAAMRDTNGYGRGGWYDDGSYAATRIAGKLERLTELASSYANTGHWRNTVRVSATFVEELAPQYQPYYDQNSDLASLLSQTDDTLADILDAQDGLTDDSRLSTDERKRLIDAILTIWATDINAGGVDFSYHGPEAIARGATAAEQHYVADWLRRWMQSLSSNEPNWYKQAAIRFLSTLAGDAGLSDRELLAEYRNAALWEDATALLLELDHIDEAVALAARHLNQPTTLLPFADRLLATRNPRRIEQAISLVDDLLWEHEGENIRADQALREWLEQQYARYGKPEKALEIARSRFKATPNKSTYDAVKTAALLLDQTAHPWAPLRKELLAALRKGSEWYALMDIHLELGEAADALKALEQSQKSKRAAWSYGWGVSPDQYAARVAAAAEQDFPDDAVRLYQQVAESLIGARNRPSYQNAAGYLARIWNVLETHGRGEEWPPLIGELRQRFKTFRALQEELDVLGLR